VRWDVDGTGPGSCPVAGSGISGVEASGSATRELVNIFGSSEMSLRIRGGWNWLRMMSNIRRFGRSVLKLPVFTTLSSPDCFFTNLEPTCYQVSWNFLCLHIAVPCLH
jgi:hypothetical protein